MIKNFLLILIVLMNSLFAKASILQIKQFAIPVLGFTKAQEKDLKDVLLNINQYRKYRLRIPKNVYQHYSRFQELFGGDFKTFDLQKWVLKRIQEFRFRNDWAAALNAGNGTIYIGDEFFSVAQLEKIYLLVHEARHTDSPIYGHVQCPKNFPFISIGSPRANLSKLQVCDSYANGAYAYQAAFLYEVFARNAPGNDAAGYMYSSSIARVLPLLKRTVIQYYGDENLIEDAPQEFKKHKEVIAKLNAYRNFSFRKAWFNGTSVGYISSFSRLNAQYPYTLIFYASRESAKKSFLEKQHFKYPVYRVGSLIVLCPLGDGGNILPKLTVIFSTIGLQMGN
ncbi:MAG: hypothetical protein D6767_09915 [Candidatus Hydrogenedentota bacterium]|nr:MAG: hypothetical protein D6767_09915 [Candidatus Hydrogenedentota bacterium]